MIIDQLQPSGIQTFSLDIGHPVSSTLRHSLFTRLPQSSPQLTVSTWAALLIYIHAWAKVQKSLQALMDGVMSKF